MVAYPNIFLGSSKDPLWVPDHSSPSLQGVVGLRVEPRGRRSIYTTLGQLPGRDQEGGGCYGNQGILRGDWGPGTLVWVGFCVRSGSWINLTSPLYPLQTWLLAKLNVFAPQNRDLDPGVPTTPPFGSFLILPLILWQEPHLPSLPQQFINLFP